MSTSTKTRSVPFVNVAAQHAAIKSELLEAMGRVIDSGMFVLGAEVDELERQFAQLIGVKYAVGVNSGTDALIFALRALGVGPGDEVITAANSFIASAGCAAMVGARPVLVDVGDDYNMDPACLERAITPRTKAIIPVHLTGRAARMDEIMRIARAHGVKVVEDAAQAVCAEFRGTRVGAIGDVGAFSLHPLKTLSAIGDGGIVTTNDEAVYEDVKIFRNLGLKTRDDAIVWSGNSRLDTIQAAALLVKLKYLEEWTETRRAYARRYRELLADIPQVRTPGEEPHERAVYQVFKIRAENRDALQAYLRDCGIGSAVHYAIPMHLQTVAAELDYPEGTFPVTEQQAKEILAIPIYHTLQAEDLEYVAATIRDFYARGG
ncbi:MAG: DegT/DnrJ/EryC1/StrS family aminotransferase [Chloroflexota bacterium]